MKKLLCIIPFIVACGYSPGDILTKEKYEAFNTFCEKNGSKFEYALFDTTDSRGFFNESALVYCSDGTSDHFITSTPRWQETKK